MNKSATWLFTDFTIGVDQWIVTAAASPKTPQPALTTVRFSRADGEIDLFGKRFGMTAYGQPLRFGRTYVFSLASLKGAPGYQAGSLPVNNGRVTDPFTKEDRPLQEYIATLQNAARACDRVQSGR